VLQQEEAVSEGTNRIVLLNENTRFGSESGAGLMRNRCAFTSKDMGDEFGDAFTYAIVMGWDGDPDEPGDEGAWTEQAGKWGWDEALVAFLRETHERFTALSDWPQP
jgi:hypothetical protein